MTSKDKLLKEIKIIKKALDTVEPTPEPINWEYYLSREDLDFFRSIKPKLELWNRTGQGNFTEREDAFLNKLARIYIKERGAKRSNFH